jgi:NAD-dependent deacetylase
MTCPPIPETVLAKLSSATHVAVLTGAGVSAESGIETFRSAGGLWKEFKPEQLATPQAFAANPETVWEWYMHRRRVIEQSEPNAGHRALAAWERRFERLSLITQNVDNLHHRAGSTDILELHGNIFQSRCHLCGKSDADSGYEAGSPPICACGGLFRPAVVWFGEALPSEVLERASELVTECDVFLSVGTQSVVYPAAGLIEVAHRSGAYLIEINPEETPKSPLFDATLRGPSGIILSALTKELDEPASGGFRR